MMSKRKVYLIPGTVGGIVFLLTLAATGVPLWLSVVSGLMWGFGTLFLVLALGIGRWALTAQVITGFMVASAIIGYSSDLSDIAISGIMVLTIVVVAFVLNRISHFIHRRREKAAAPVREALVHRRPRWDQ